MIRYVHKLTIGLLWCALRANAADNVADFEVTLPPPVSAQECLRAASTWQVSIPGSSAGETMSAQGTYRVPVLFNSAGVHCYSPPIVRQGDLLLVGMVLRAGEEPPLASVDFTGCPLESVTPDVLANGDIPKLQGGGNVAKADLSVYFLDSRTCGGEAPTISLKIGSGESAASTPYKVNQYKRYRATFHLGAVYTDLREPDFALRSDGMSNVIFDKEANERGPEYVATLIVPGIAYYIEDWFRGGRQNVNDPREWGYKGRDPLHDSSFKDRLGLVLSAGIEHPGDRFGVGLSYEIAYGINLVALYELAKLKHLEGVNLGDTFMGTADQLTTDKEWESKFSLGLTFDLAYVSKLFGGRSSGG